MNQYNQFFYKETHSEPMCLFFIAGMIECNHSYLSSNLISASFVDEETIALLYNTEKEYLLELKDFKADYTLEHGILYLFNIPSCYIEDFHNFYQGKYTAISNKLITKMYNNGLHICRGNTHTSHPIIWAMIHSFDEQELNKKGLVTLGTRIPNGNRYLQFLEEHFDMKITSTELMEKPKPYNFKTLDEMMSNELSTVS